MRLALTMVALLGLAVSAQAAISLSYTVNSDIIDGALTVHNATVYLVATGGDTLGSAAQSGTTPMFSNVRQVKYGTKVTPDYGWASMLALPEADSHFYWDGTYTPYDPADAYTSPLIAGTVADGAVGTNSTLTGDGMGFVTGITTLAFANIAWVDAAGAPYRINVANTTGQGYELSGIINVPEPATMSVLGLGALALIRRRRA